MESWHPPGEYEGRDPSLINWEGFMVFKSALDPNSKMPEYKVCAVRTEKV